MAAPGLAAAAHSTLHHRPPPPKDLQGGRRRRPTRPMGSSSSSSSSSSSWQQYWAVGIECNGADSCGGGRRSSTAALASTRSLALWIRRRMMYQKLLPTTTTKGGLCSVAYYYCKAVGRMVVLLLVGTILCHRAISWFMRHRSWVPAPITYLSRTCPAVPYETILSSKVATTVVLDNSEEQKPSICITTLTDHPSSSATTATTTLFSTTTTTSSSSSSSLWTFIYRLLRWRDFDTVLDLTWSNKERYAVQHGYRLVDGSPFLDRTRPPAWSKIRAVQHLLSLRRGNEADDRWCDWVMWTDADAIIMNSDIRIEDFLPPNDSSIDLLVASDKGGGYNSGVFLVRNVKWSHDLLTEWWDMRSYVRVPGLSLSGDNAALKALLADKMNNDADRRHIGVPPRCTFNSFAKFLTWRESRRLLNSGDPVVVQSQEWYFDTEHYHRGDFIAHTPGIDNKAECLELLLREAH